MSELNKHVPAKFNTYYEPFIGGGAFLLNLQPKHAVINDFNTELYYAWKALRDEPYTLASLLKIHSDGDAHIGKEYYLDVRSADRDGRLENMTSVERAARFIFMNIAGFNGLWRVNKKGQNNVPYGRKRPLVNLVPDGFFDTSKYLKDHVDIFNGSYLDVLKNVSKDDFVYLDPPYVPLSDSSSFTRYTNSEFGYEQQVQLRDEAIACAKRGAFVMLSNSDTVIVRDLYKDTSIFKMYSVLAKRTINSDATKRGAVGEVIITTY